MQCIFKKKNYFIIYYGQPLEFRRFYVTRTFLHYDVTSSLHKSWENPCYPKPCIGTVRSKSVIQRYFCMIIILIYHDCDFKKMRIQKLLNRVEKYRWIFLWTTRHNGKWFFLNISLSNVNFFPPFVIFMACFAHRRNSSGVA